MEQDMFFDGTKSIPLNQLPKEAWRTIAGKSGDDAPSSLRGEVGWIKRCMLLRAEALASMPWSLQKDGKEVLSSEITDIPPELEWMDNFVDLLWLTDFSLVIGSQAFWKINRSLMFDTNGELQIGPTTLQWLAPKTMKPQWNTNSGLVGFTRTINNQPETLSPMEICYFWIRNPEHETEPEEPLLKACTSSGLVLKYVDEFATTFFKRGAVKATILTVDKSAPKTERDRVKTWWTTVMSGISNAWRTQVVSSAVEPVTIGDGIKELSNTELTMERRQDIATTLGVPHSLVFSDSANFATADVDRRNFYVNTVIPTSRLIAKQANRQLFRQFGYSLTFQPERLSIFQTDEQDRSISFLNYIRSGMKPSIAAQILGLSMPANYDYTRLDEDFNMIQAMANSISGSGDTPKVEGFNLMAQAKKAVGKKKTDTTVQEEGRFKRWAVKRFDMEGFDVDDFQSDILDQRTKLNILEDMLGV